MAIFKPSGISPTRSGELSFSSRPTTTSRAKLGQDKIFSGGFIGDVMDVLDVSQFAITGALDPRKSVKEAISGRYRPSDALGVKNKFGKFATDVLLDPLNLAFGIGAVGKGIKLAGKTAKAKTLLNLGERIAKGSKALEPFSVLKKASSPLRKKIGNIPEVKAALGAFRQRRKVGQGITALQKKFTGKLRESGQGVSESKLIKTLEGLSPAEKEAFVPVLQRRASVVRPSEDFLDALKKYEAAIARETRLNLKRGSLVPEQVKERIWAPLVKVTGRSKEELAKLVKEPVYVPGVVEDRIRMSDYFNPSRVQKVKPGFLKKFTGTSIGREAAPEVLVERRLISGIRHRVVSDHIDEVQKVFGVPLSKARKAIFKGGEKVESVFEEGTEKWIKDGVRYREFKPDGALRFFPLETAAGGKAVGVTKKVPSFLIPEQVYMELNRFFGSKGGLFNNLMKFGIDPSTDLFRLSVLGLSPRWVFNNFFGNLTVSAMHGAIPSDFFKAFGSLKRGAKARGQFVPKSIKGGLFRAEETATSLRRVVHRMEEMGTLGELASKPFKAMFKVSHPVFKFNIKMEDIFRRANYFTGKRKGLGNGQAVKEVNKWLFDYSNLTSFERRFMRKLFPFWSWTRNINALAFKLPATNPEVVAFVRQGRQFVRDLQAEGLLAPTGDIPLHPMFAKALGSPNQKLYLDLKPTIPFNDVGNVLNAEGYLNSLAPAYKIPLEIALRTRLYGRQPFSAPYKEVEDGKVINPLPPLWRHIANVSPQFRLVDDLINPVVKFDTGEPLLKKGKVIHKPRGVSVSSLIGPKFRSQPQIESQLKREGRVLSNEAEMELAKKKKFEKQKSRLKSTRFNLPSGGLTF